MHNLILIDNPRCAGPLREALRPDWQILPLGARLMQLTHEPLGVDVRQDFALNWEPLPTKKEEIQQLREAVAEADAIYIATAPDTPGELLGAHALELAGDVQATVNRVWLTALDPASIRDAFQKPRPLDERRSEAELARVTLDQLVQDTLSPGLSVFMDEPVTLTPALAVALHKLADDDDGQPKTPAWTVMGHWQVLPDGPAFQAQLHDVGNTSGAVFASHQSLADAVGKLQEDTTYTVEKAKSTTWLDYPAPAYTTSSLLAEAVQLLGLTPTKALRELRRLYEGGHITYPLTGSDGVPAALEKAMRDFLRDHTDSHLAAIPLAHSLPEAGMPSAYAILPTRIAGMPQDLSSVQQRLYRLIWRRFADSQLAADCLTRQTARLSSPDNHCITLELQQLSGADFPPRLHKGDQVVLNNWTVVPVTGDEAMTSPAALLDELGAYVPPRQIAQILPQLKKRGLIDLSARQVRLTERGRFLARLLGIYFKDSLSPDAQWGWRQSIHHLARGQTDRPTLLNQFWEVYLPELKAFSTAAFRFDQLGGTLLDETCPQCQQPLVQIRDAVVCLARPACPYTYYHKRRPLVLQPLSSEVL
ncbi:MAG: DNA topoisomerase [Chloroflexi bacterium]|nr:DNA topoisomerase [Chloroflexota bacterium]